jgi:hypothetical protein
VPRFGVYGLIVDTPLELPGLEPAADGAHDCPATSVLVTDGDGVERRFSGPAGPPGRLTTTDGEVIVQRGSSGDLRLTAGGVADCHVSGDGTAVACAPEDPDAPAFVRLLLDTVLGTAALCRGREGLHAAAVLAGERLIAITAPSGGGKSTLAEELIRRGAVLFSDDLVFFSEDGQAIVAHPGPAVMALTERWQAVKRPRLAPRRLDELIVLDRRPGGGAPVLIAETSPLAWLAEALDSGPEPERRRQRLDLLSRVAAEVRLWRLRSAPEVAPGALADAIENGLGAAG